MRQCLILWFALFSVQSLYGGLKTPGEKLQALVHYVLNNPILSFKEEITLFGEINTLLETEQLPSEFLTAEFLSQVALKPVPLLFEMLMGLDVPMEDDLMGELEDSCIYAAVQAEDASTDAYKQERLCKQDAYARCVLEIKRRLPKP